MPQDPGYIKYTRLFGTYSGFSSTLGIQLAYNSMLVKLLNNIGMLIYKRHGYLKNHTKPTIENG